MLAVGCALGDPAAEEVELRGRDLFVRFGRWHDLFRVFAQDAFDELAGLGVAGLHGLDAVMDRISAFGGVEAQVGLALLGVEAMAGEAVVGKDGRMSRLKSSFASAAARPVAKSRRLREAERMVYLVKEASAARRASA
jgi:hypothetical protein